MRFLLFCWCLAPQISLRATHNPSLAAAKPHYRDINQSSWTAFVAEKHTEQGLEQGPCSRWRLWGFLSYSQWMKCVSSFPMMTALVLLTGPGCSPDPDSIKNHMCHVWPICAGSPGWWMPKPRSGTRPSAISLGVHNPVPASVVLGFQPYWVTPGGKAHQARKTEYLAWS